MSQSSYALPVKLTRPRVPTIILAGFIMLATILVVIIFSLLAHQVYFLDRVHLGVQLNGMDVSQLTYIEVEQLLIKQTDQLLNRPITLASEEERYTLTAAELGAWVDIQNTANQVFSIGRESIFISDLQTQYQIYNQPINIMPVIHFNSGPANSVLQQLTEQINQPPQDAQLNLQPDLSIALIPPQIGQHVDIEANRQAIREAILGHQAEPIILLVETTSPQISEFQPTYNNLQTIFSQPPIFTFEDQRWPLEPAILADMLIIRQEIGQDEVGRITASLNETDLAIYFHNLALNINQQPIDAWFNLDTTTWVLTPTVESQTGYALDVEAAVVMMKNYLQSPNQPQLTLPVAILHPAVSMEDVEALGIIELVSSSTTYFKGSSTERMQNIKVATSKFHGLVIPPGEIFSFNKNLGDITAEEGYVESLIIQGDQTAVGVGGGVCQVSTTVFRTAFYGGFEIVERWAHGYRVGWYETGVGPGLDATIYSPYVDFKFRNDTESYLLIQTEADLKAGTVTFSFYGTSPNRTITISEPEEKNVIAHGPTLYQEDPDLKPGEIKQVEWAQDGVDVSVHRTVEEEERVIHKDTIFSRYRPWQAIYKVGPKVENNETTQNKPS